MAGFTVGQLVEIIGLAADAAPAPGVQEEAASLNDQKAQLLSYDRAAGKWVAATFNGYTVSVDAANIRELGNDELDAYDFVYGPKSDASIVGEGLAQALAVKGYAVMRLFVSDKDVSTVFAIAQHLEKEDHFSRMATELAHGYLGIDGCAKTVLIDPSSPDSPQYVQSSPLKTMDANLGKVAQMLEPHSEEILGFDVHSRTQMLLRVPLGEGDEEKYPVPDIDDVDLEGYMHTMHRKKLTLLQFVGPASGSLTLVPTSGEGDDIMLEAEPHTLVLVMSDRYDYEYETFGESLSLASFLLKAPASFVLDTISGDTEVLGMIGAGPPPPPAEQVSMDAMFCRYGGGSNGKEQFYNAIWMATDGLTCVPLSRFDVSFYYDPDQQFGGQYTKHGCFGIEGVELFDNKFFEISQAEARGMDPCQRQVMEVSYSVLCEGGWDKKSLARQSQEIGHFCGIDKDDWLCMSSAGLIDLSGAVGAAAAANAITSNRFSYSLNLKGASMTIDTACSSSLICTHVSKLHIRNMNGDKMIASIVNGLNLMLYQGPFVGCCGAGMLSHEGRSFTFNATADGYARGELCGAMMFKLNNFVKDGNQYACLAGSQANQDGRSASMTAPNGPAQEKCINSVLKECGLTPTEVDCFECHGTGTSLGDPIEVGAVKKVMSATPRKEPMVITSSKSNIAHGEGGAGLAGFFKCVIQVANCEGKPNVHLRVKNPHLDLAGFPCQILSESVSMREDSAYSGVSSFGFGGTNGHCQAWGANIFTSRGTLNVDHKQQFQKRLNLAPPAEISMVGSCVDDWETTGFDPRAGLGSKWKISMDEEGVASWEQDEEALDCTFDEFFIQGSFNDWQPEVLERHDTIPGLWIGILSIGGTGQEDFQITGDGDSTKVFHPATEKCSQKSALVQGPDAAAQELAWVVQGEAYETYRVEFFQQGDHTSISWMRQVD